MHRNIDVQLIDREQELLKLEPYWNNLLARSNSKSVFLTWEWVKTWWEFYGENFSLCVLLATEDGSPCGISPTVVRKGDSPRLEFVGQNRAYGEYLDFIISAGEETQVAEILCTKLIELHHQGVWQRMNLGVIPESSPNVGLISLAFSAAGLELHQSPPRLSPWVALPTRWADYLELKGNDLRRRIAYNHRRLGRHGKVRVEYARTSTMVESFYEEFVRLHNERWGHQQDATFLNFHRRLAQELLPLERLLLARLKVGETTAAIKYDFVFDDRIWGYQGGWRRDMAKLEVGSVLLCEIFSHGIENGFRAYDFLEGDDWYKRRWSTDTLRSHDLIYGQAGGAYVF